MNDFFLDSSLLKELSTAFLGLADIEITIFDTNGNVICGEEEDVFALEDVLYCLNKLGDVGVESVVEIPQKHTCAIAMRNSQRTLLGIWMVLQNSGDEREFTGVIQAIDTIVSGFISAGENAYNSYRYAESVEATSSDMSEDLEQTHVVLEILKKLESEEPYEDTCKEILEIAGRYLEVTYATLLRTDEQTGLVCELASWNSGSDWGAAFDGSAYKDLPFSTGLSYTISFDSRTPAVFKDFLDEHNISAAIFLPMHMGNPIPDYLCICDRNGSNRRWTLRQSSFLNDVKRVLSVVMLKGVSMDLHRLAWKVLEDILNNTSSAICVCDYTTEDTLYTNSAYEKLLAYETDKERLGVKLVNTPDTTQKLEEYYIEGADCYVEIDFAPISWSDGRTVRLCTINDISSKIDYKEDVDKKAGLDEVTGLENRPRFVKELSGAISSKTPGAVILVNIEGFKEVNTSSGYEAGDSLLASVAAFLKKYENSGANVYRMGADEYALLIKDTGKVDVMEVASSISKRFQAPWQLSYKDSFLTARLGLVQYDEDTIDYSSVLRSASIALSKAKHAKESNIVVFKKGMEDDVREQILVKSFLKDSIDNSCVGMELIKTPCEFHTVTGKVYAGFLARLTWDSGELGVFGEYDYLPLARKLGLEDSILKHKILNACKDGREQNDFGYPASRMAVCVGIEDLLNKRITDIIRFSLQSSGIVPDMFVICVSGEFAVVDGKNRADILEVLRNIKNLGVHIASLYPFLGEAREYVDIRQVVDVT